MTSPSGTTSPGVDRADVLGRFSEPTRTWFSTAFAEPTAAQVGAWESISAGQHTLVVAPTGSGKTLSAFLWAIDELAGSPIPAETSRRCRVLYVSPLKALASDVERNLRSPLIGIGHECSRLGLPVPQVTVAQRTGDTPASERRAFQRTPPDVLITTPESLFLLLTSRAREQLVGVETVIVDEVHAVAGTKRGAHLALSLERLDALLDRPAQRIGLSATVRPPEEVLRFLTGLRTPDDGGRRSAVVQPPSEKEFDLRVVVPVPDLGDLGSGAADPRGPDPGADLSGNAAGAMPSASIWPHVEERVVDLVAPVDGQPHRSSLVFTNSRRLAERLTARLNETWAERLEAAAEESQGPEREDGRDARRTPAEMMAQAGASAGAPAILARAHHGSVSKEQRALIEDDLKAGRLPTVVATSSLELGIDMGAIDLVIQVEAPPSVASGLQRVGRAGHQVGAVSRGVVFPKYRSDLVTSAVVTQRMRDGKIESLRVLTNPLDVLAQQVVAMTALDDWDVDDLFDLVRRSAPFSTLTRPVLDAVLDMLAGRYPSEEFAELRPRIVWDRVTGVLSSRPGAQRLAVTSGGTIPDRGLYGVFLAGDAGGSGPDAATRPSGRQGGRRVGELDEEMVYESRVGDVFTLGASTWRIMDITHDQVLVVPAPGQPGKLPFWHGDAVGRPAELGRAVGAFVREIDALDDAAARERLGASGLDAWAADNLVAYLREQRAATGHLPDDRTIVVERFRDELGDWRVVIHSPFGSQVHAPWAMALAGSLRKRYGLDVQAMPADDGIVLRMPDLDAGPWDAALVPAAEDHTTAGSRGDDGSPQVLEHLVITPDEVPDRVTEQLGGSALFASRFRECAARSLLLPRRRPDRRQPLWQQRQRAAQLLEVASAFPSFPVILETVRECLQDVFDVPGLQQLMRDLGSGAVQVVEVTTEQPSPFARSLLFGYVAQFLYEGDSPLAERRAAALALDPDLLAELLGRDGAGGTRLADLLDPEQVVRTHRELQHLVGTRQARHTEDVADLLRVLGPQSADEVLARSTAGDLQTACAWLGELVVARRAIEVVIAGERRWAAVEDAARLRDGLGTALPVGLPLAFTEPVADPVSDLVSRYARTHVPFTALQVARRFGLGVAVVEQVLNTLTSRGRLATGELLPDAVRGRLGDGADASDDPASVAVEVDEVTPDGPEETSAVAGHVPRQYCDAEVLRVLRRRSLAALRAEVEPVPTAELARFLPSWQHVGGRLRGVEGVLRVAEQLCGARLPASALESLVLPARVQGYSSAMLDELTSGGELVWCGHGSLPGDDGWVSLHVPETAHLTLPLPDDPEPPDDLAARVLEALDGGGAYFFRHLVDAVGSTDAGAVADALWQLVWAGRVSGDTLAPLRARLQGGRTAHRPRRTGARARYGSAVRPGRAGRPGTSVVARSAPPTVAGRWALLPEVEPDPTARAALDAELLLERYGVVTRGSVVAEGRPGGFAASYRVLSAMEEAGRVRRGYFVEALGAAQFATTAAVDRLRATGGPQQATTVLAATDPANPFGAALDWPPVEGTHRPARKAGALVVLHGSDLVLWAERGGRTLLTWTEDPAVLREAAGALAATVRSGALGQLTVTSSDGDELVGVGPDHPLAAALLDAGFHPSPGVFACAAEGRPPRGVIIRKACTWTRLHPSFSGERGPDPATRTDSRENGGPGPGHPHRFSGERGPGPGHPHRFSGEGGPGPGHDHPSRPRPRIACSNRPLTCTSTRSEPGSAWVTCSACPDASR